MQNWKNLLNRTRDDLGANPPPADPPPGPDQCTLCGKASICNGMGVVSYDVPYGHEYFGKLLRCPNNPVLQDEERMERLRQMGNLSAYKDKTFQEFKTFNYGLGSHQNASLDYALKTSFQFAHDLNGWLLLQGTYGCGKTHLAAAVGNEALRNGHSVMFITVPDLLDHLRSGYNTSAEETYHETFERVRRVQVLILDDLGTENPSAWALEKLFQLLNHRYTHRMPTVITTNNELSRIDPRIRSRLMDEGMIRRVVITAPDYRSVLSGVQGQDDFGNVGHYREMTFAAFTLPTALDRENYPILHEALETCRAYAANPEGWLVLHGNYGTGKTHLAAAIANEYYQKQQSVMFVTVLDLMDHLRQSFDPRSPVRFDERFDLVRDVRLLVLDSLSTANASSWAKEKLFQIIDHRYVNRLPTVFTISDPLNTIDKRMMTRLGDRRVTQIIPMPVKPFTSFE